MNTNDWIQFLLVYPVYLLTTQIHVSNLTGARLHNPTRDMLTGQLHYRRSTLYRAIRFLLTFLCYWVPIASNAIFVCEQKWRG